MKTKLIILLLLGWAGIVFGQESFKRVYYIPATKGELCLKREVVIKYHEWTEKQRDSMENIYKKGSVINITEEIPIDGKIQTLIRTVRIDKTFYNTLSLKKVVRVDSSFWGYIKFDEDRVIVNKNRLKSKKTHSIYYYTLENRDQMTLNFIEGTVSAFTIPFKYRFKQPGVSEEFSTASLNANLFGGISIGKTSFFYRDKVGSITNNHKLTLGIFVGSSVVELNSNNTSGAEVPLADDKKIIKGLASVGLGIAYSYNKINFGGFLGWDYAIGNEAEKWNYNKKPWIGIAIGYSLFNL